MTAVRPETTLEHIARDMREGRFPERSEPQMVADLAAPEPMYLICKHGMYYRPNCQGYTSSAAEAGRYTLAEAKRETHPNGPNGPRDGMSYIPAPADIAAVQPAQARVKPLVWGWSENLQGWRADCELTRDVFCAYETNAGWVASSQTTGSTVHANADAAKSALDGYRSARILAALEPQVCQECSNTGLRDTGGVYPWGEGIFVACDHDDPQPDPRDEVIKGLVEAATEALSEIEAGDVTLNAIRDLRAALAAAKAVQNG